MTPTDFMTQVAQPNMQAALEEPDDLRATVNAVLALDALMGLLYVALKQADHQDAADLASDDKFRDRLAERCQKVRVLRDLAAAFKHGELTNPKPKQPRLLHSPGSVNEIENRLGTFELGDRQGSTVLMIALADNSTVRASHVIGGTYRFLLPMVDAVLKQADA